MRPYSPRSNQQDMLKNLQRVAKVRLRKSNPTKAKVPSSLRRPGGQRSFQPVAPDQTQPKQRAYRSRSQRAGY